MAGLLNEALLPVAAGTTTHSEHEAEVQWQIIRVVQTWSRMFALSPVVRTHEFLDAPCVRMSHQAWSHVVCGRRQIRERQALVVQLDTHTHDTTSTTMSKEERGRRRALHMCL